MAFPVTINGNTYTQAMFDGTGYVTAFPAIFSDLAAVAANIAATVAAGAIMVSALQAIPGTVSAPGYTFGGRTNDGIYSIASHNIGVTLNGAKVLDIGTSGLGVAGTLAVIANGAALSVGNNAASYIHVTDGTRFNNSGIDNSDPICAAFYNSSTGHRWLINSGTSNPMKLDTSGIFSISTNTASISTVTGCATFGGGIGVAGTIYAATVNVVASGSASVFGFTNFTPGLANGNETYLLTGISQGANTSSYFGFHYNSGSPANSYSMMGVFGAANDLKINGNGVVVIGQLSTGSLTSVSGVLTSSSDARMKKRVGDFTRSLIDLRNIGPAETYDWDHPGMVGRQSGWMLREGKGMVIAIPEAVSVGKDLMYSFSDRPVLAACVNAIIEVDDKVVALTVELAAAKSRIAVMEASRLN